MRTDPYPIQARAVQSFCFEAEKIVSNQKKIIGINEEKNIYINHT